MPIGLTMPTPERRIGDRSATGRATIQANRMETMMSDTRNTKQEFCLNDLDAQLQALLPDKEAFLRAFYYCCECVGNPDCPSQS